MNEQNRALTNVERTLVLWMLEHSGPDAEKLLPQLDRAHVTPWKCPCGCASFNLVVEGEPEPPPGCRPVADFVFGPDNELSGVFLFESGGLLAGLEVYGLAGDAPKNLPSPEMLRPLRTATISG